MVKERVLGSKQPRPSSHAAVGPMLTRLRLACLAVAGDMNAPPEVAGTSAGDDKAFVFGSTIRADGAGARPVDVSVSAVEATSGEGAAPGAAPVPVQAAWAVDDAKPKVNRPPAWGLAQQMGEWVHGLNRGCWGCGPWGARGCGPMAARSALG